jgi:hypothetical protein
MNPTSVNVLDLRSEGLLLHMKKWLLILLIFVLVICHRVILKLKARHMGLAYTMTSKMMRP